MDMSAFFLALQSTLGSHLPQILGALAIFALGWLLAVAARAAVRRVLAMLAINTRIEKTTGSALDAESPAALAVFWVILLAVIVAALNALDLSGLSGPLAAILNDILAFLPRLLAGSVLALVAWLIASLVRAGAQKALEATPLNLKLTEQAGMAPMSQSVGNVLFWLVVLLFLPAVLAALQLHGLLEPMQGMLGKTLDMVPNLFAAVLIGVVGWLVARIMRGLVGNLAATLGVDKLNREVGMDSSVKFSSLAGTLVYIMILVPSLIAALDALKIEAISKPATSMLNQMLSAVPNIITAAVILLVTWFLVRFAAELIRKLLQNAGIDAWPAKLGMGQALAGTLRPSQLAGVLVVFFGMLLAVVEAANQLGFAQVGQLVDTFVRFGGDVLLGSAVLVIGFWLANVAHAALSQASEGQATMANIARAVILGLVIAMGLRAMGIANEIVQLAFGLTFGAVAVAVALSFGLGGREAAGRLMEHWLGRLRKRD
jgi:hypothetical protein